MKFTDGYWQVRPGVTLGHAVEAYDIESGTGLDGDELVVSAPTAVIRHRGDTLNRPMLTVTISSPLDGVIRVRAEHFIGGHREPGFDLVGAESGHGAVVLDGDVGVLTTGELSARIAFGEPWSLEFFARGRRLTGLGEKSLTHAWLGQDAQVDEGVVGNHREGTAGPTSDRYTLAQLDLGVGETIYGLGERFGPLVKNGQSVEIWNSDGGTSSEQAYKAIPFHLSSRGYGVLVNDTGHVSYEVGSEMVERVQMSVSGESIEFLVIDGPDPAGVLERYTRLTGRPASVPAWTYGLWLSTSFTTDYDEATVTGFVDAMEEHDLPLSVFHFDCFWMREFNWCDFEWDPRVFPDPVGMLTRLKQRGLRICVWINPYIGQRSPLFAEAASAGYLVRRPDGRVWQWDLWQAGMALVDFTNPDATAWYQGKLRSLLDQGVDAFKTDFGERIPLEVTWFDGSSPDRMHNWYTQLYNQAVFEVLEGARGEHEAVLFARSATVGGQRMPVHWGGDSSSTFASMAETLRGGLSLALSGFGFWSHDIGGFEGTPDPAVYKRWTAFGLLSSHSRFHGSGSYRVPWAFDDEAVHITRKFARLKNRLMPYLFSAAATAHERGVPVMRPMLLEFPDDPAVAYLDRQYMLGPDLLVAPVFSEEGEVEFYLPKGRWTRLDPTLAGGDETIEGGRWLREVHALDSLPLFVREGAVIPVGASQDRPDYDYLDGLTLELFPGEPGERSVRVVTADWQDRTITVQSDGTRQTIRIDDAVQS